MDFALNDRRRRASGSAARLVAAFGLRRFAAGYAGPLVRLRRASDNAESNFSAGADMWLDEAAVLAWCGGSSAYVRTLYGQAGGLNLGQATASAQPRLVNAGVMDAMAGRPALRFLGAQWLAASASSAGLGSVGLVCSGRVDADAANDCGYWGWSAGSNPRIFLSRLFTSTVGTVGDTYFTGDFTVSSMAAQGPFANPESGPHMWECFMSATAHAMRRDGVAVVERSAANGAPHNGATDMLLGRVSTTSASYFEGWIGDVAVLGNGTDADVATLGAALRPEWGL